MSIKADVQNLNPGPYLEFWEFNGAPIGAGVLYFQGQGEKPVWWQGVEYDPWPCEGGGFEQTTNQQPTPTFKVGNLDGSITRLCKQFQGMVGATLTRRRTFAKYLDAVNFPDGNPTADPTKEFPPELWFIERKSAETAEFVEFELSSSLNFQNVKLPRRQIVANQCSFTYRGALCNYVGPPVADVLDQPTSNPALDRCGKRLQSCELRVWPDNVLNFGGFPAAGLVR